MTKKEFKKRWEQDENGGGITYDDIADCYVNWRLGTSPKTKPILLVRYVVLKAANTNDAEEYNPENL
jgi:hypothetical protein